MRKMEEIIKLAAFTPGENCTQGLPVIFWGDVGRAKSAITAAFAKMFGLEYRPCHLANYEPTDIEMLIPDEKTKTMTSYIHQTFAECFETKYNMIFFDELSHASGATQAVAMPIFLDRVVGGRKLPPENKDDDRRTFIVGAANPAGVAAVANQFKKPTANRTTNIWIDQLIPAADLVDPFVDWMENGAGDNEQSKTASAEELFKKVDEEWEAAFAVERNKVARFIQANPELLQSPPDGAWRPKSVLDFAFPTMRSVAKVARISAGAKILQVGDDIRRVFIEGTCGGSWAHTFLTWEMDYQNLPNVEKFLDKEEEWKHDNMRPDRTLIVLNSCYSIVRPSKSGETVPSDKVQVEVTEARIHRLWKFMEEVMKQDPTNIDFMEPVSQKLMASGLTRGQYRMAARPVMLKLNPLLVD